MREYWNTVYTVNTHETHDSLLDMIRIYIVAEHKTVDYYQSDFKDRFITLCKEVGIDLHPNCIRYYDREFTIELSEEDITRLRLAYSDAELLSSIRKRLLTSTLKYSSEPDTLMLKALKMLPFTSALTLADIEWDY